MKKEKLRKENSKGITLIALVITIIVLLILAAVTIATLTGENGILTKANEATQKNNKAKAEEEIRLAVSSLQIEENQRNIEKNEKVSILEQELKSLYPEQKPATTVDTSGAGFLINHRGYEFEIDDNYNISYKEPFNAEEWDKTATSEDSFIWGSNTPGKEGYNVVVGYTEKVGNSPKLVFPSRCEKINLEAYSYENKSDNNSRSFCSGIEIVELPSTVTEIGPYAFASSDWMKGFENLKSIIIPKSVKSIRYHAFFKCEKLTDITMSNSIENVDPYVFESTGWYNNQPDGMIYIGKVAYRYKGIMPSNTTIELKQGTTSISSYAFGDCENLISMVIPDSITTIERGAFSYCTSLKSIEIPRNVIEIKENTFYCCTNLNDIVIPDNITKVGNNAFYNTAWYENQPDGIIYVGKTVYQYKGAMPTNTNIVIKEGTTQILSYAFQSCGNLISIVIPNSVVNIGERTFINCTGLENIEMSEGITRIESSTFDGCTNLKNINIPQNVKYIGEAAFADCINLSNIIIWKNMENIAYRTFEGWQNTQTINIEANQIPDGWDQNWNYGCNANIVYAYTGE